jgi:hypothetical protein
MRVLATLAFTVVAGCTAHNPNYQRDLGPSDLAGVVLDLSGPGGPCNSGQRSCAGTESSERCENGMFVVDRVCPYNSECMQTYCAPPTPVASSSIGERCDTNGGPQQLLCLAQPGLSCQPFVDPLAHSLRFFCDKAIGAGVAGSPCTRGNECRSGFCASNGTCFEGCLASGFGTGCLLTCKSVDITVEGIKQTVKSCAP